MALGVFPTRNKAKRNVSLPTLLFHVIRCVSLFEFLLWPSGSSSEHRYPGKSWQITPLKNPISSCQKLRNHLDIRACSWYTFQAQNSL